MSEQGLPGARRSADQQTPFVHHNDADVSLPSDRTTGDRPSLKSVVSKRLLFARRTLGILLILVTVFSWTASSFLASEIFADNTYSKPFFVTYVNTSFFSIALIPTLVLYARKNGVSSMDPRILRDFWKKQKSPSPDYGQISGEEAENDVLLEEDVEGRTAAKPDASNDLSSDADHDHTFAADRTSQTLNRLPQSKDRLDFVDTVKLSLEFCLIWFVANYFAAACLKYTTVASSTILSSTSSIWTLFLGAMIKVETFTIKKLIGVLASLTGVVLISTVDLSGENDKNRGNFPHKSHAQLALGDAMAFFSAVAYGVYTILMKKRIQDESRVNMPLFFGLVGLFNVLILWPGFFILHFIGEETFKWPPTKRVWAIVLINSSTSLVSDFCWAYANLLTSPLLVAVGLSLTIPLSLVGQMIFDKQYSSVIYWIGAVIVLLSFVFINHESKEEAEEDVVTT